MEMTLKLSSLDNLQFDLEKKKFIGFTHDEHMRYLKGMHSTIDLVKNYTERLETVVEMKEYLDVLYSNYDNIKPFTYKEAFELENDEFRAVVFGTIDISEMIENLGAKRIKSDGMEVERKIYSENGEYLGMKTYHNIYETYEVNGNGLGLDENMYALKVWCTSTNKEHWLWIEDEYKNKPLDAVASTFRFHENVIPHIKELKRQGDVMIVEMNKEVEPEGNVRPLTKEEYFGLLTSET